MTARMVSCLRIFTRVACSAHLLACLDAGEPDHPRPNGGPLVSSSVSPAGADTALLPSHLPCEIENLMRTRCKSCHSPVSPLHLTSLLTREDLLQPSRALPGFSYAQQAQQLIQSGMMPPTSSLAPADIQLFSAWVDAGAPAAECGLGAADAGLDASIMVAVDAGIFQGGGDATAADAGTLIDGGEASVDAGDPFHAPTRCTSDQYWLDGDTRSEMMHPGRACIDCHTTGVGLFNLRHGPAFTFAGTIFPSAHEPDDCNGAPGSGVSIIVKGANGQAVSVSPNTVGNFRSTTRVTSPYTVEVHYQGRVRVMTTPQTNGDCNSCHSERGANGAPGRIALP